MPLWMSDGFFYLPSNAIDASVCIYEKYYIEHHLYVTKKVKMGVFYGQMS